MGGRKKAETAVLRTSVPLATADRLDRLARVMGTTVPDLLRYFITMQMVRHEKELGLSLATDTPNVVEAVRAAGDPGTWDRPAVSESEALPVGAAFGRRDPKAHVEVVNDNNQHTHGEHWTGYMRGL